MNCLYCQTQLEKEGEQVFRCLDCHSFYQTITGTDSIDDVYRVEWHQFEFNQKRYMVNVHLHTEPKIHITSPMFAVYSYYADPPSGPQGQQAAGWREVMKLDFVPNWTPHNIIQKLKMHLVFI